MYDKLFLKISQRKERVGRIKAFLVFPVATLHLAIMSECIRADLDARLSGSFPKRVRISRSLLEKRLVNSKPLFT